MGYAFHITRAEFWYESEQNPISQQEWELVAAQHADLYEDGYVLWKDIGRQPVFVVDGEVISFSWQTGRIVIEGRYTDRAEEIASQLAASLNAKVQGDDPE